ncbi:M50 family metallopeptidase [Eubacterium coprostanoligenes]|uniref:Regulator of sigma E protease n=1 Tax=Eubacterium coprostanoligenes TaxID=290054 RepID=A0A1T4KJP5_9FIRM|nr:M50 family metallopeptidase [Eubacterium coprostanoligenes]MCI6354534.1 site-2 protease family protein [Eubacterium coprostanoligenes]MDY4698592.1 M50 family metallopeptidase [Eubacterium coprostanoligenes]MDY5376618.1 M50 family metallopeptidase [Eubacterium coprostanoligenes]SJZ42624.1 regulator of sigma E protease [Eubacterium coprostanoligenes]
MSHIWQTVYPILIAILFFELIILVHEGGHFFAAKMMKVKVNEFSIGMGPKLFQFQKGDTKFTLRLILFGGYCAMEGEDSESDDKNSFANKKVIQRVFVVVAGAVMNLILGVLIILGMVCSQELVGTPVVADFDKDAVSNAYLEQNDRILAIDGMRVYTTTDITTGFSRSADGEVEFLIKRDGKTKTVNAKFNTQKIDGKNYIDMDFYLYGVEKTVPNVLRETGRQFMSFCRMIFLSLHDLITGKYGLSDMSGPVGTVSVVSGAVKMSLTSTFRIMAFLTINIGLFNLFPFPALDGWKLFILLYEGIFKKKLPQKFEWMINAVGLAVLLGLMCLVTFSDITKLF